MQYKVSAIVTWYSVNFTNVSIQLQIRLVEGEEMPKIDTGKGREKRFNLDHSYVKVWFWSVSVVKGVRPTLALPFYVLLCSTFGSVVIPAHLKRCCF